MCLVSGGGCGGTGSTSYPSWPAKRDMVCCMHECKAYGAFQLNVQMFGVQERELVLEWNRFVLENGAVGTLVRYTVKWGGFL